MIFSILYELKTSKAGSTTLSTDNIGIEGKRNVIKKTISKKKPVQNSNDPVNKKNENQPSGGTVVQNSNIRPIHGPAEHPTIAKAKDIWKDPLNKSLPPSVLKSVNNNENSSQSPKTVRVVGTKGIDPNINTNAVSSNQQQSQASSRLKPVVSRPQPPKPIKTWGPT